VARALGVEPARLVRLRQVHGSDVVVIRAGEPYDVASLRDADIVLSDDPSRACAIQTADCVPLLVADRGTGAVAAAHAGWRGLAGRVPEVAIAAMAREFGSRPADLVAVIGPSISACCYEVGADVREAFTRAGFAEDDNARWFFASPQTRANNPPMPGLRPPRPDHWYFDGWIAARHQLESAGVNRESVGVAGLCSASHARWLCSYRRDGKGAGRMAAAIRPRR
jgi:polyphenol oxidase